VGARTERPTSAPAEGIWEVPDINKLAEALHDFMVKRAVQQGVISKENETLWQEENEQCKADWRATAKLAISLITKN
jgi:hypothetical protein